MSVPVPGRIVESLRRSTVRITSGRGNGSGIVLAGERIVTNAHVIAGQRVNVESWEGKTLPASLQKIDRRRDLAILAVSKLDAPAAILGDSNALQAGTPVVAVGNPLGFTGAVSSGVIHYAGGATAGSSWIYADVRLAPGNSGGPLADFRGQVIGVNTMIVSGGLSLAISSRAVQSFLNHVTLGVVVRPIRLPTGGIGMLILDLEPGGATDTASLLPGDILAGAHDVRFTNLDDLQTAIQQATTLLHLDFYRAGQKNPRRVSVDLQAA